MARPQNQKRWQADGPSEDQPPAEKVKSKRSRTGPSNFPPEFWDNLPKVWLTPRALRELDRRNLQPLPVEHSSPPSRGGSVSRGASMQLARFARHGGPDLGPLRGYPEPVPPMAPNRSSASGSQQTQNPPFTPATDEGRKSSAYDDNFEQHLVDHCIYPQGHEYADGRPPPKPGNVDGITKRMAVARASLSLSRFSESHFCEFERENKTRSEGSVMRKVIPLITGNTTIPNEGHLQFTNFDSMTEDTTVKPVPDFFDGARRGDVDQRVRKELDKKIIPTKPAADPIVPNFFMEVKAPQGRADVAIRQALYDGAYGARAMHSLQNYGKEEPSYDGNAYTYSSTYHNGILTLYAHHVTAPTTPCGQPEFHMTKLRVIALTDSRETFVEGVTAFRNLRDIADEHRKTFITATNAKAIRSHQDPADTTEIQDDGPSFAEPARSQDVEDQDQDDKLHIELHIG